MEPDAGAEPPPEPEPRPEAETDAGTHEVTDAGANDAGTTPTQRLDSDGVVMLFPPNPNGSSWNLGGRDPNTVDRTYFDLGGDKATPATENGISFWTTTGHKVSYASGAPDGVTVRLNIKASGGTQTYTWRNGAATHGYISNPRDLKNFEATAYVRVRDHNRTHTSMSWKVRGGRHTGSNPALSSCTGMQVPYEKGSPRFLRELDHPDYDYINLTPRFPYLLQEGKWLAVKMVSYLVGNGTKNLLYLDTDPFDANGKPRNDFRLYAEWIDRDGVDTGEYTRAATWGGWLTTFRVDGWRKVDFAILSAREIVPPDETALPAGSSNG